MIGVVNVLTSWGRASFNETTGITSQVQPTINNAPAHAALIPSQAFHELPQAARKTSYVFLLDPGTDIVTGDQLLAAYDIITGNIWPADYPIAPQLGYTGTLWMVRFHHETATGAGAYRALYVEKVQTSGPASSF